MDQSKKNEPSKILLVVVAIIVSLVIFYLALTAFFPEIFQQLNTGETVSVDN